MVKLLLNLSMPHPTPSCRAQCSGGLLFTDEDAPAEIPESVGSVVPEMAPIKGRVKWFDATRGFGFLVSDEIQGDVLLHFSVLREHGRRSVPEGALIECVPIRLNRGLQARRILSIDLSTATAMSTRPRSPLTPQKRSEREALYEAASKFQPVEVKWFNRVRGYGFVTSGEDVDIFVHMDTVRKAGLSDLQGGDRLKARIARGPKGLTAVELRIN